MYKVTEKVIRLMNNTLLIGGLVLDDEEQDPDFIIIGDPVEIIFNEEGKISMKNWMPVASNGMCHIPIEMIIAIADPDKATSKKYHGIIYHLDDIIESIQSNDSESSVH